MAEGTFHITTALSGDDLPIYRLSGREFDMHVITVSIIGPSLWGGYLAERLRLN